MQSAAPAEPQASNPPRMNRGRVQSFANCVVEIANGMPMTSHGCHNLADGGTKATDVRNAAEYCDFAVGFAASSLRRPRVERV
jgi:hypothetical protein